MAEILPISESFPVFVKSLGPVPVPVLSSSKEEKTPVNPVLRSRIINPFSINQPGYLLVNKDWLKKNWLVALSLRQLWGKFLRQLWGKFLRQLCQAAFQWVY